MFVRVTRVKIHILAHGLFVKLENGMGRGTVDHGGGKDREGGKTKQLHGLREREYQKEPDCLDCLAGAKIVREDGAPQTDGSI